MSFPKYPAYKDSGVKWIEEIPVGWEMLPLKRAAKAPLSYGANASAENDNSDWPRFIRITDIDDAGLLRADTFKSLPPEEASEYLLDDGDILFARSGATVGKSFLYKNRYGLSCYAGYLIRLRVNHNFSSEYIYYFSLSLIYKEQIESGQIQSTIQNFSAEKYANLSIPFPSFPEQQAIASFLDRETGKIDALIAEQEKLLTLLAEKRQATISHAVTRGLNPNAPMKDSGIAWLGEVPEHWEISKIKYIVREGTSVSYGIVQPGEALEQGVPFIQTSNMSNASFDLENLQKTTDQIASAYPRSKLVGGEVILGIRASIGSAYVVPEHLSGANLSRGIARIECSSKISSYYLVYVLRGISTSNYWNLSKQGSTFNEVSIETVRELSFALPPRKEQNDISKFIKKTTSKLEIIKINTIKLIDILKERRSALIAAAVTGKIDVRNAVPQEEAA